jgi:hypothetical protein
MKHNVDARLKKKNRDVIFLAFRLFFRMSLKHRGKVRATRIARHIAMSDPGCLCSLGERKYKFKKDASLILGDSVLDVGRWSVLRSSLFKYRQWDITVHFNMRLVGPQNWCGYFGEEENLFLLRRIEARFLVCPERSLVTILMILFRLPVSKYEKL